MKFIDLYNFKVFSKRLYKIFILMVVLFIVSAFITQLFLKHNPQYITNHIKELYSELKNAGLLDGTPLKCFIIIFLNNLKVSIVAVIIGLIPYLYLSAFVPIYNGFIIGLVITAIEISKQNALLFILLGIIPHGVFEMFAILYASSIGIYITKNVFIFKQNYNKNLLGEVIPKASNIAYNNIFVTINPSKFNSHKHDHKVYLKDIIPEIIKSYVFIIIPLLVIAAFIETFITPELFALIS